MQAKLSHFKHFVFIFLGLITHSSCCTYEAVIKITQEPMKWTAVELIELQKLIAKLKECIPLRNPASPVVN